MGESPATYLRHNLRVDRSALDYERIARSFFAISLERDGVILYSRCNFSSRAAQQSISLNYVSPRGKAFLGCCGYPHQPVLATAGRIMVRAGVLAIAEESRSRCPAHVLRSRRISPRGAVSDHAGLKTRRRLIASCNLSIALWENGSTRRRSNRSDHCHLSVDEIGRQNGKLIDIDRAPGIQFVDCGLPRSLLRRGLTKRRQWGADP